ncbi:MAG: SoxR reducing system RseC family protein [Bacillota bacterium]
MDHFGQVVELKEHNKALVKVRHNLSCSNCGRCGGFFGDPEKNQYHLVEVFNPIGAAKGQLVRLEARASEMLMAAFLLYLLPLVALLVGLFAGRAVALAGGLAGSADMWGLGTGLIFMVLLFSLLRLQERRLAKGKRFKAVIAAVVSEEEIPEHARLPAPAE